MLTHRGPLGLEFCPSLVVALSMASDADFIQQVLALYSSRVIHATETYCDVLNKAQRPQARRVEVVLKVWQDGGYRVFSLVRDQSEINNIPRMRSYTV